MQLQEVVLEGRACGLDVYQDEGQDGSGGQQEGQQEVQLQQVVLQRCAYVVRVKDGQVQC